MIWFWFNHFNVHQYKHNIRAMLRQTDGTTIAWLMDGATKVASGCPYCLIMLEEGTGAKGIQEQVKPVDVLERVFSENDAAAEANGADLLQFEDLTPRAAGVVPTQ